jgi:SAM-dependent methyltransferase
MSSSRHRRLLDWVRARPLRVEGERGIRELGHREYVGGLWDAVGRLQFDFLVGHGLRPDHSCLDIGCGALRAGVHLIPYLDPGRYCGIEKHAGLLQAALEVEISRAVVAQRRPRFVVSTAFEFERFGTTFDCALAHSLFTHLTADGVMLCLRHLRSSIAADGVCWATFLECEHPRQNPTVSHDHGRFEYTRAQMVGFGAETGWSMDYVGDWGHPRGQVMVRYLPA